MSLLDNMIKVYDRTYKISDKLGVKQHVDFGYTNRLTSVYTIVTPRPKQTNPPPHKLVAWQQQAARQQQNIEVNNLEMYITGVSRTFSGIMQGATCKVNGKNHTILWIDEDQSVTYNLLIRPERSR